MNEKKVLRLSIFEKTYVVTTDESEADVYQAARLVDELLRSISVQTHANNEGKIAVLAALKFAADLIKHERNAQEATGKIESIIETISRMCPE